MNEQMIEPPEPALNSPKRQHFLPRFYLKGFGQDDCIFIFDRNSGTTRKVHVNNATVVKNLYTVIDKQGKKRYEIENMLSSVEGKASIVLGKLSRKEKISDTEREDFSFFLSLSIFRTPEMMVSMKGISEKIYTSVAKILSTNTKTMKEKLASEGKLDDSSYDDMESIASMSEMIDKGELWFEHDNNHNILDIIKRAEAVSPCLWDRNWFIAHAPKNKSFITADSPYVLDKLIPSEESIMGLGFGSPNALLAFPLTQNCVLLMYGCDKDCTYVDAKPELVRRINLTIADRCQRFLIGRDEKLLASIAKARSLANREWKPKTVSITGGGLT